MSIENDNISYYLHLIRLETVKNYKTINHLKTFTLPLPIPMSVALHEPHLLPVLRRMHIDTVYSCSFSNPASFHPWTSTSQHRQSLQLIMTMYWPDELSIAGAMNTETLLDSVNRCPSVSDFLHVDIRIPIHAVHVLEPRCHLQFNYDVDGVVIELSKMVGIMGGIHHLLMPKLDTGPLFDLSTTVRPLASVWV